MQRRCQRELIQLNNGATLREGKLKVAIARLGDLHAVKYLTFRVRFLGVRVRAGSLCFRLELVAPIFCVVINSKRRRRIFVQQ